MAKLPVISGKEMIKFLQKQGFQIISQKGSHVRLKKYAGNEVLVTVVPVHGNSDLRTFVLLSILKNIRMTRDQFIVLLGR